MTAAVIARDEESVIDGCLRSLDWADEVLVVVDVTSRDATERIARDSGARVVLQTFISFPAQRNAVLDLARSEWVLFVDADERVTAELAAEVRRVVELPPSAYWIPRHNRILGRWMRGTGWYPDEQLRLLRRDRSRFDERVLVHEVAAVDGEIGRLGGHLVHFNYSTLLEFWMKQQRYSRLAAVSRVQGDRAPRRRALLGAPARELWRRYVTLHGYRDGAHGLLFSALLAYFELETVRQARALARK